MSFSGGVLILAVIVLRSLALNRLPKGTFLALWAVAALRLMVPFSISSPVSVYTLAARMTVAESTMAPFPEASRPAPALAPASSGALSAARNVPDLPDVSVNTGFWGWSWLAGAGLCAGAFLFSYLRCWREFRTALPAEEPFPLDWLAVQRLRRRVSLRWSDKVDAPLTYGLLRPVILLPKAGTEVPLYALEHEMVHIRRLDALWKPLLALTACVHWFNPLVWCMFVLANRDMELRCDEVVVRRLGLDKRNDYALTLISMEEGRSGLEPFASAFSKNAIEERIRAIMKIKKRSLAAILAAVVLVCCMGVGFATSAKEKTPCPKAPDGTFTKAELDRLASLWFEGYEDMTVAKYQQKMWAQRDTPEDIALIERYGQSNAVDGYYDNPEEVTPSRAFHDYFHYVYEPLTSEWWQERYFSGLEAARDNGGRVVFIEYTYCLQIRDPNRLTVGEYQQVFAGVKAGVKALLWTEPAGDDFEALSQRLSTDHLTVVVEAGLPVRTDTDDASDTDAAFYAQTSAEIAGQWDALLSPYAPFGLTWEFNDPDHDGNGLTMWFDGREVCGIMDPQEGTWITEHAGNGFSDGAVELYTVYTAGKLSGLRLATAKEQAEFDESRKKSTIFLGVATLRDPEEQREFPQATREDYDAFLTLRTEGYAGQTLKVFNQRLLDWANENNDAWDRINCDVIWNDCGVDLTPEEWTFVSRTCLCSGTENGQMIRALYTGGPEEDPGWARNLPEKFEEDGIRTAWCNLYYDISYHITDRTAVTVSERDACVSGMQTAIERFWQETELDALLDMTEEDIVAQFNIWARANSTDGVRFAPITGDNIHFESADERRVY